MTCVYAAAYQGFKHDGINSYLQARLLKKITYIFLNSITHIIKITFTAIGIFIWYLLLIEDAEVYTMPSTAVLMRRTHEMEATFF